jgi:hypothetical protein
LKWRAFILTCDCLQTLSKYIKQTTQDNDFLLYAYAVWDAGLASAVISLLLF